MSTICKLAPLKVRAQRTARRDALRALERVLPNIPLGLHRIRAAATHAFLKELSQASHLTGAEKDIAFTKLIKALEETNHGHSKAA